MQPDWFTSLVWTPPLKLEQLREDRSPIPKTAGVYVFTNYDGTLRKNTGVLYVGKAKTLHSRLQSYLADPSEILIMSPRSGGQRLSSSLRHAGKVQLLVEVQQRYRALGHTDSGIWIRWTVCSEPAPLEGQLISYLQPAFNTHGR
jgi:hypothetical protein